MTDLLMADFSVDAATIGHFGSVYYFACTRCVGGACTASGCPRE